MPPNPEVERSQVERQENAQTSDSWKQHNQEEASRSTSTRKLVQAANSRTEFRNMQYMTEIFHFLLKKLEITEAYSTFSVAALKTNVLIWGNVHVFVNKAAIHFGPNYLVDLEVYKNTNFEEILSLFNITQKLILQHSEEILNVNTIESTSASWMRSVLSRDLMCEKETLNLKNARTRSSSCSMFNDVDRTMKGNDGLSISNSEKVKDHAKRFLQGHWTFESLNSEKERMAETPHTSMRMLLTQSSCSESFIL